MVSEVAIPAPPVSPPKKRTGAITVSKDRLWDISPHLGIAPFAHTSRR